MDVQGINARLPRSNTYHGIALLVPPPEYRSMSAGVIPLQQRLMALFTIPGRVLNGRSIE